MNDMLKMRGIYILRKSVDFARKNFGLIQALKSIAQKIAASIEEE